MSASLEVPASLAEATAAKSEPRWTKALELGYEEGRCEDIACEEPVCFACGKSAASKKLSQCSKCNTVHYVSVLNYASLFFTH